MSASSGHIDKCSNGNLLKTQTATNPSMKYDAWNRMVEYTGAGLESPSSYASKYDYPFDALGRRVREDEWFNNEVPEAFPEGQRDLYYSDRWQVIEDRLVLDADEDPATYFTRNNTYVWTPGYVDELITRDTAGVDAHYEETEEGPVIVESSYSARVYVQQDHNFNVTSLTNDSGTVTLRMVYDPYGKHTLRNANWSTASSQSLPDGWVYLHQGGRYSPVTGLYHFRNRDYSASLGRWVQMDPMGYLDGMSLYAAVTSNPLNWLDPEGFSGDQTTQPGGPPFEDPAPQPGVPNEEGPTPTKPYDPKGPVKLPPHSKPLHQALQRILDTPHGDVMVTAIGDRGDKVVVHILHTTTNAGYVDLKNPGNGPKTWDVYLNLSTKWYYWGDDGKWHILTLERALAHELGHVFGESEYEEKEKGGMGNIDGNETPVMEHMNKHRRVWYRLSRNPNAPPPQGAPNPQPPAGGPPTRP